MPETEVPEGEQLQKLIQIVSIYKAIENAAFTAAMTREEWKKISRAADKLGTRSENPEEESPHTADVRTVSILFTATPVEEAVATSLDRIKKHKDSIATSARQQADTSG